MASANLQRTMILGFAGLAGSLIAAAVGGLIAAAL
jgi:hypothetical protein